MSQIQDIEDAGDIATLALICSECVRQNNGEVNLRSKVNLETGAPIGDYFCPNGHTVKSAVEPEAPAASPVPAASPSVEIEETGPGEPSTVAVDAVVASVVPESVALVPAPPPAVVAPVELPPTDERQDFKPQLLGPVAGGGFAVALVIPEAYVAAFLDEHARDNYKDSGKSSADYIQEQFALAWEQGTFF